MSGIAGPHRPRTCHAPTAARRRRWRHPAPSSAPQPRPAAARLCPLPLSHAGGPAVRREHRHPREQELVTPPSRPGSNRRCAHTHVAAPTRMWRHHHGTRRAAVAWRCSSHTTTVPPGGNVRGRAKAHMAARCGTYLARTAGGGCCCSAGVEGLDVGIQRVDGAEASADEVHADGLVVAARLRFRAVRRPVRPTRRAEATGAACARVRCCITPAQRRRTPVRTGAACAVTHAAGCAERGAGRAVTRRRSKVAGAASRVGAHTLVAIRPVVR